MKPQGILLFFLSVFALMGLCWFFFPSGGVEVGGMKLRFPSYQARLDDIRNRPATIDVDSVLMEALRVQEQMQEAGDSLSFYKEYLSSSPNRIHLPGGDWTFFDPFFEAIEKSASGGKVARVMHYGDSQLEMDRISSVLRQQLQDRFGGSGPGMVLMQKKMSSVSLIQGASGGLVRYSLVADSLSSWTSSHRYGPLTQTSGMTGGGTFSFRKADNRYAQERAKRISRVSVLLGRNSSGLRMTLKCDTLQAMAKVLDSARSDVSLVSWELPSEVSRGTISFTGNAEVYGIMLDGGPGVTVDNVAMRGSSGTVFTGIDSTLMRQSFEAMDTRLIILQFGGNAMPGIGSRKAISSYMTKLEKQFEYFRSIAPDARLLFVGPADMSKSIDGHLVSWPLLQDLNDSLRVHCLGSGVAYWDTFSFMGGAGSMREWVNHSPPLAGPDYIHFTTRGAEEVGRSLSRAVLVLDNFRRLRLNLSEEAVKEYMEEDL